MRGLSVLIFIIGTGCASGQAAPRLDRSYEAATAQLGTTERSRPGPAAGLAVPLDRDAVVALAIARSPTLTLAAHRARALVHAGRAEASLPPAELGFEAWNLPLSRPYALGEADMYMLELRQRFPAAGSLDARARAISEEAQAVLAELSAEEHLVAERAADAFAEYVQAFAERRLEAQQVALLERMGQVMRARYTTGGSGLADATRIDLEIAKARRGLARIQGDIARACAALNALLRRPAMEPLGDPPEAAPETVRLSIDELLARARSKRGLTLAAEARQRAAEARRTAAEAEARAPELTLGVGYWQDPEMRPGFGVTASMSLPWLWGPGRHRVAQAEEERAAQDAARDAAGLEAQAEVTEAHARLVAAEQQLVVLRGQAVPAARRSIDALTAAFSTGNASLLEWVDTARSVLDLEMEAADLSGELSRGIAALERAVGTALPRVPLALGHTP